MRRIIYAFTATAVVATGAASVANAKQVVPMHTQDVQKTVTQAFRSVAVSADYGDVKLQPGTTTTVYAHEEWNVRQPTLAVSVSRGVLHVAISCNGDVSVGNVVTVGGALDQANDCIDSLTVTTPATVPVQADTSSGSITATGLRGGIKLSSGSGDVSVRNTSGPQVDASSGNGTVIGTTITAGSIAFDADSGGVTATSILAHSVTLKSGNGAVTAKAIKTTLLTADSDAGDVTVTDAAVAAQAEAHCGNGALHLTRIHARSLGAADDAGDVSLTAVTAATTTLSSGDGGITARQLRSPATSLHSDSGTITAALTSRPQTLTATSGNGDVNLDVPTGRYDIEADSDNGTVRVTHLITDTSVRPFIRAHSDSGNVTITGH